MCLPVCIFIGSIIAHWIFWGLRGRNTGRFATAEASCRRCLTFYIDPRPRLHYAGKNSDFGEYQASSCMSRIYLSQECNQLSHVFWHKLRRVQQAQKERLLQFLEEMGTPRLFGLAVQGRAFCCCVPVPYRMPGSLQREHIRAGCPGAVHSTARSRPQRAHPFWLNVPYPVVNPQKHALISSV